MDRPSKQVHPADSQPREFDQPPKGYKPPRYPREYLPEENEKNLQLGGAYQKYIYHLGDCCGTLKAVCPCLICCVDYPYKQIDQGNVGLYERFGMYVKTEKPGLVYVNPCTDTLEIINCKVQLIDCPRQFVMTQDNILVSIDATVYYRIISPCKSTYYMNDIKMAISNLTLATIKSITGAMSLQDLLEKRQAVTDEIQLFVDQHVWEWGIDVENLLISDIQINQELQEALSMVTKETRAAQAKIINAQADVQSAEQMKKAADFLDSKAAMQIRYLETIGYLGKSGNTKVIFLPE